MFGCVVVARIVSLLLGGVVDAVRGNLIGSAAAYDLLKTPVSLSGVIARSAAVGVFFGVASIAIRRCSGATSSSRAARARATVRRTGR